MTTDYDSIGQGSYPDVSRLRVLVVDDLAFSRSLARSLLIAAGVSEVDAAPSAERGWELLGELQPDLLVLDWELAGQSGLDLLRRIRTAADSPNPKLPVLMLTAYREEHRVRQAIAAGTTSYLTKPFSPRDFLMKMKFCLEQGAAAARGGPEPVNGLLVD